jgi:HemY protein
MIRAIVYFALVAAAIAVAYLLVLVVPGTVAVQWLGWRVETSIAIAILALLILCAIAAVLYYAWRLVRRAPRDFWSQHNLERRNRGYRALSHGLVAVAAGDKHDASRWSKKAEKLLHEQPLSRLLSAQAAQLNGDSQAARAYFKKMLESEETRFLGLRGLLMQALRDGDDSAALSYLKQARDLRPETPWVIDHLFEVSQRLGELRIAEQATLSAARYAVWPREAAYRKRAVVLTERARRAYEAGDRDAARKDAEEALRAAPDLVPAALLRARLEAERDRPRKAAKMLEHTWRKAPHPDLAQAYLELHARDTALTKVKRIEKLTSGTPDHPEARIARARAALEAELWGEARKHLQLAAGEHPDRRVCFLMAEVEQRETGDREAAHDWLRRAEQAELEPLWVCHACGAASRAWSANCGNCGAFDALDWRSPLQVSPLGHDEADHPERQGETVTGQAVVLREERAAPA